MADDTELSFAEIRAILAKMAIRQDEMQKSQAQAHCEWQQRQAEWERLHEKWKADWEQKQQQQQQQWQQEQQQQQQKWQQQREVSHRQWEQRHEKWKADWQQQQRAFHREWQQQQQKWQQERESSYREWEQRQAAWEQRHEKWKADWEQHWAKSEQERKASQAVWEKRWAKSEQERKASQAVWEKRWAKSEQRLNKIEKMLGGIGDNIGDNIEELFFRSFQEYPVLGGITYDIVRRKIVDDKQKTEYDILLHNGYASAIIEVKYKAHYKDIEEIVTTKTQAFRNSYPEYAHHQLFLGLATGATYQTLIDTAKEHGIYLLTQKGSHMEIVNENVRSF